MKICDGGETVGCQLTQSSIFKRSDDHAECTLRRNHKGTPRRLKFSDELILRKSSSNRPRSPSQASRSTKGRYGKEGMKESGKDHEMPNQTPIMASGWSIGEAGILLSQPASTIDLNWAGLEDREGVG